VRCGSAAEFGEERYGGVKDVVAQIKRATAQVIRTVWISLFSCLVVLLCVDAVVMWYVRRQEVTIRPSSITLDQPSAPQSSDERPRSHPIPSDLLLALETPNDFQMRYRISDIPEAVRVAFAEAAHLDAFSMAEPGARWQATDVIVWPRLPWRRLIGVAVTGSFCLVFYEHGGRGESNNVGAFRSSPGGVEPVGHSYLAPNVRDPATLRLAIERNTVSSLDASF
jgi:hypothetical protein